MEKLYSIRFGENHDRKLVEVYAGDITDFPERIDVLTISSFQGNYTPVPGTLIGALYNNCNINIEELSKHPKLDARELCHVWLSEELVARSEGRNSIGRIGDIELLPIPGYRLSEPRDEMAIRCFRAYFRMLELAITAGITVKTLALPLVGTGNQGLDMESLAAPLISECIAFLRRNNQAKRIIFVDKSYKKAQKMAEALENSYTLAHAESSDYRQIRLERARVRTIIKSNSNISKQFSKNEDRRVFISYSEEDTSILNVLDRVLEAKNYHSWYAPRDVTPGATFGGEICQAISTSMYFFVLLSNNSIKSYHVLNEVSYAFDLIDEGLQIVPVHIGGFHVLPPSLKYYLNSVQQYEIDRGINVYETIKAIVDKM